MDSQISIPGHGIAIKGEPWFEDGNIVLVTQDSPTGFRVHRGVLSRHSEVFSHMLEMPQPSDRTELFKGCQIVTVYDLPCELANLIKALYDGPIFSNRNIEDFFYVAGILRLSNKYFVGQLRRQAIEHLGIAWPSTLEGHDSMIETALSTPSAHNLTYPYAHPLHVLNLAREVDAPILIPSALYFLSIYPLSDILKADHPKLLAEHSSRPSSSLQTSDLILYTLMYQHRFKLMDTFMREFCQERASKPACGQVLTCGKAFSRLITNLHRSWTLKTGPLHFIAQAMQSVAANKALCYLCSTSFQRGCSNLRKEIWDELPNVINLSYWDTLS